MIRSLTVCLGALLVALPLYGQVIDLPQMGEPADNSLSPAQELEIGQKIMGELYSHDYVLDDPELEDYVIGIGWKLAAQSATTPAALTFFAVADSRINAFALPGGFIGVNVGLINAASNESELAGVLGHEIAHVTQRHIARSEEDTKVANLATWAGVLAAVIAGSVTNPDLIIGALAAGSSINQQRAVNYTRAHEQEADRIGIQTMAAAGYNPDGMAGFFGKLEQQSRLYGSRVPEFLLTHPLNTSRISEARARAAALPRGSYQESADFPLMQARAIVLAHDRASDAVGHFGTQLTSGRRTPANAYGYALALARLGNNKEAMAALKPALDALPKQVNLNLLKGRIQQAQGQNAAALQTFADTLKLYPRYAPAIFASAEALIASDQPLLARQLLISHEQALGTRMQTYSLLSSAAQENGNLAEASYQMATYYALRGDPGNAIAQLDAGLRLAELSPQDRARLTAKRQEIRKTLPSNWKPAT